MGAQRACFPLSAAFAQWSDHPAASHGSMLTSLRPLRQTGFVKRVVCLLHLCRLLPRRAPFSIGRLLATLLRLAPFSMLCAGCCGGQAAFCMVRLPCLSRLLSVRQASFRMVCLLCLCRLPNLPPTFGSSSASHSLLATFRQVAAQHVPNVSQHLRDALSAQLQVAIQRAEQLGPCSVPELAAEEREEYVR